MEKGLFAGTASTLSGRRFPIAILTGIERRFGEVKNRKQ
jgi:hypothetical protein